MRFILILITLSVLLIPLWEAQAEPWLSNRYAQNCSACHAPGRINRKPKDRRCTLSCQGCHVNPNGGGLRNHYGMWNSQRFLRSFYSELTWNEKLPKPFKEQKYANPKIDPKLKKFYAVKGAPLETRDGSGYDENDYKDHSNYKRTAQNKVEDYMYISSNDPYRKERNQDIYVTGDLRLFYLNIDRGTGGKWQFWPMALDVGMRIKPLRNHKLSLVYETRAFTFPRTGASQGDISIDYLFGSTAVQTRSAYMLYDDLPYNGYVQAGFMRPLFGIYNPNHRTLFSDYTGLDQFAFFKVLGVGLAPNVPFFMFNVIQRSDNPNPTTAQEEGFLVTGGLRGVTLGLSLVGSYWSTRQTIAGQEARKLMIDVNGGMQIGRFTLNGDLVRIDKTAINGKRDASTVLTAETKARIWRENYLMVNYAMANAAIDGGSLTGLSKGSGGQMDFGYKGFFVAGTEFELLYQTKENKLEAGSTTKETAMTAQLHLFF